MKKLNNFSKNLEVLRKADFEFADSNEIYRTGIIWQFSFTFELAWKALQEVLKLHGAIEAETGSPREILQLGYKMGFLDDSAVWLLMLKKRNTSVHIYNEDEVDELLLLIRDSFIPAFSVLEKTLKDKVQEARDNGGYIAGAMLQEKRYFDIFLKKIGYELTEEKIDRQKVFLYLKEKNCAMLGIKIDERHKHAVVYTGNDGDVLLFINNKHRKSDEPCEIRIDEGELRQRLDDVTAVASLKHYEGEPMNPLPYMQASLECLDELYSKTEQFSSEHQSRENVLNTVDTLFRPLLLDSVAMMELAGASSVAECIRAQQKKYIDAVFKGQTERIRLCDYIDMAQLKNIVDEWKRLTAERIDKLKRTVYS